MRDLEYINTFEDSVLDDESGLVDIENGVLDEDRRTFTCPSCAGVNITLQGRCVVCTDCGWSSCVL